MNKKTPFWQNTNVWTHNIVLVGKGVFIIMGEGKKDYGNVKKKIEENISFLNKIFAVDVNFDIIHKVVEIGGKTSCIYFIDGFNKDDITQKILQYFYSIQEKDMAKTAREMSVKYMPYGETELTNKFEDVIKFVLSGQMALLIDGFEECIMIDNREYPVRSVGEPEKDKVLRGSKDGFVETIVFNTAFIRRRIRSTDLCMEITSAGNSSRTDIALCYMNDRVDHGFLENIKDKIRRLDVDALTMNQESLAECLYQRKWYNPFPKFKFSERPDTASAQILEGNVVILVDNSPSAMILPTTIFDVIEEADDYYFPPLTGTYLRLSRFLIALLTYFIPPTFLLLMLHPEWIPKGFEFILVQESIHVPLIWQFLILELALDGLRLAAVNTPNMLSTPLSIMAALVLGEFSVNSGWFNSEVMLYMAFVALSTYTQQSYELGYAIKFMRIITLILTQWFSIWGYVGGILFTMIVIATNKTISGNSYISPIYPFDGKQLKKRFLRTRLPHTYHE